MVWLGAGIFNRTHYRPETGAYERDTKSRLDGVKGALPDQFKKIDARLQAHTIYMPRILRQQLKDIDAGVT